LALKKILLEKSGGKCWYCGADEPTTKDHQTPKSRGGNGMDNNVASCRTCNLMKHNLTVSEYRERICYMAGKKFIEFYGEKWQREQQMSAQSVATLQSGITHIATGVTLIAKATIAKLTQRRTERPSGVPTISYVKSVSQPTATSVPVVLRPSVRF
jgi:hypothetical protein